MNLKKLLQKENLISSNANQDIYKDGNNTLVIQRSPNSIKIELTTHKPSLQEYCKDMDDEVFVEACELYSRFGTLKELEAEEVPEDVEIFKECVREATKNKIKKLERYL